MDYLTLNAQSGRTAVIDVTTLDEKGQPTEGKAAPVIGAWSISDPVGTLAPAVTSSPFNITTFGVTRLNAQFLSSGQFRIGVGDLRGDGRPDYQYLARVLYADTLEPSRVSVRGSSPIEIDGIGLSGRDDGKHRGHKCSDPVAEFQRSAGVDACICGWNTSRSRSRTLRTALRCR